jgi:transcriptional regulator with XRE-family HTH domain
MTRPIFRHPSFDKKVIWNIVSERVREARVKQTLTQDQLSGQLAIEGVALDRVAITKIESGLRCVFDYEVRALAYVLKVDIRWLLNIEERTGKGGSKAFVFDNPRQ